MNSEPPKVAFIKINLGAFYVFVQWKSCGFEGDLAEKLNVCDG
jgi:hypothetical protein